MSQFKDRKGTYTFFRIKVNMFSNLFFLYSPFSRLIKNHWKGKHDDKKCKEQRKRYALLFDEKLHCEFKGNKSKIQVLIRKLFIDSLNRRMFLFQPGMIFPDVLDLKPSAFLKTLRAGGDFQAICSSINSIWLPYLLS